MDVFLGTDFALSKSMDDLRKNTGFALTACIGFLLLGCGKSVPRASKSSSGASAYQLEMTGEVNPIGYDCTGDSGLMPVEKALNGSGEFKACVHEEYRDQVIVEGFYTNNTAVCVFPILVYGASGASQAVIPKTNQGYPIHYCGNLKNQAFGVKFPGVTFNSLAVVRKSDEYNMMECLVNKTNCPNYSYGRLPQ